MITNFLKYNLSTLWTIHWITFVLILGISVTVDLNGCILWLPETPSCFLTVFLFTLGFIISFMLLIRDKRIMRKIIASLAIIFYVLMIAPAVWPF